MEYYHKSLIGEKFDKLTVIEKSSNKNGHSTWKCMCECGEETVVRADSLKSGRTKSCGCERNRKTKERVKEKHPALKHGMSKTSTYGIYRGMLDRCHNKNSKNYDYYGLKDVTVCERWRESFENFLEDMGERPNHFCSLERVKLNLDYSPDNVVWATSTQQNRNRCKFKNNKSGVTGVYLLNNEDRLYWIATWVNLEGKLMTKYFSVVKFGFEPAKQLAVDFRTTIIESLNNLGGGYSDLHGK